MSFFLLSTRSYSNFAGKAPYAMEIDKTTSAIMYWFSSLLSLTGTHTGDSVFLVYEFQYGTEATSKIVYIHVYECDGGTIGVGCC